YLKASNTDADDRFGVSLSLSGDGSTLSVGATYEASTAAGTSDAGQDNNDGLYVGAVYVFVRSGSDWDQQAYLKASNPSNYALFGGSSSLSSDGSILAVGATGDRDNASGPPHGDNSTMLAPVLNSIKVCESKTPWKLDVV